MEFKMNPDGSMTPIEGGTGPQDIVGAPEAQPGQQPRQLHGHFGNSFEKVQTRVAQADLAISN